MDKPMMKCGHAANSTDGHGNPACVICYGIHPGASEVAEPPNLAGRKSRCVYGCGNTRDSSTELPFFEHVPDKPNDRHYCGCRGWD